MTGSVRVAHTHPAGYRVICYPLSPSLSHACARSFPKLSVGQSWHQTCDMIRTGGVKLHAVKAIIGRRAVSTTGGGNKKRLVVLGSGWGGFNVAR